MHLPLSRGMSDADVQALLAGSLTLSSAVGDRILARGAGHAAAAVQPLALAGLPPQAALLLWRDLAWCLARRLVERTAPPAVSSGP